VHVVEIEAEGLATIAEREELRADTGSKTRLVLGLGRARQDEESQDERTDAQQP
jgi:hypothetical protein